MSKNFKAISFLLFHSILIFLFLSCSQIFFSENDSKSSIIIKLPSRNEKTIYTKDDVTFYNLELLTESGIIHDKIDGHKGGTATFADIPVGFYTISVDAISIDDKIIAKGVSKRFSVRANETTDVSIKLKLCEPATLKSGQFWFDGTAAGKNIKDITKIRFQKDDYEGAYTASWDAGTTEGLFTAYLSGTEVIISANGNNLKANENCSGMFRDTPNLTSIQGLELLDTSDVTDMSFMFTETALTTLNLSSLNTSNVTTMRSMFTNSKFTSLDLSSFDTSNVTTMFYMFYGCANLMNLNLTNFKTSKVDSMTGMFMGCSSLTDLNLVYFDTSKVTDMSYMFTNCSKLETITASTSTFTLNAVSTSDNMFSNCTSLKGGSGTTYDESHKDGIYAQVDYGPTSEYPGYFTAALIAAPPPAP